MKLAPIRNDFQREKVMETLLQHLDNKKEIAPLIRRTTRNQLRKLHPVFTRNLRLTTASTANRQSLVRARDQVINRLSMLVRHFRNSLTWRAERMNQGPGILRMYLPIGDIKPNLTIPRDVLKLAEFLVEGEAQAVDRGYPPMQNPSAAELSTLIPEAKITILAVETGDLDQAEAQEALRTGRIEADQLLRTIARQIQMELDDKPESYTRRLLRRLGYQFIGTEPGNQEAAVSEVRQEEPGDALEIEPDNRLFSSGEPEEPGTPNEQDIIWSERTKPPDRTRCAIQIGPPWERACGKNELQTETLRARHHRV